MARKKKKKHVILVDDDPAICKIAQKILESAGFTVETYRSFRPMLSRLGEITPELLIVDLNVPDCSGFQFLQLSKKEEGLVNSPILVMSGRKDRDSVVKSISLGAGDYVVKPFTTKSLLQKVRKVIFSQEGIYGYSFPQENQPEIQVNVNGKVVNTDGVGFVFEGPCKIASGTKVSMKSDFLDQLEVDIPILHSGASLSDPETKGEYLTRIRFVGLSAEKYTQIRKKLKAL